MSEATEAKWYYADGGKRVGPIPRSEVEGLIRAGKVEESTSVWSGEGEWRPAKETDLAALFAPPEGEPPPLAGGEVDNRFVWLAVAVPLVGVVIELAAGLDGGEALGVYLIANIICCVLDERRLKAAGHEAPSSSWAILVPAYLWMRASRLKQKRHYFWAWIVAFAVSIMVGMGGDLAVIEESAVPLVTQIIQDEIGPDAPACKAVEILEEVSEGFYKAKATLANGNDIDITIELKGEDELFVQIPLDQ
jgi:hypothetical protein